MLFVGEPGCGFEVCARHLHLPNTPWVAPENTDWLATNPFEPLNDAREGTLFLAEIGELGKAEQKGLAQLLSQAGEVQRAPDLRGHRPARRRWSRTGASTPPSTTSSPGSPSACPRSRDHAEDIPDIAATLLTQFVDANEVPLRNLTVGALNVMRNLDWPGNLPVLQNVVKTLALTALANDITGDDVNRVAQGVQPRRRASRRRPRSGVSLDLPLRDAREQFEKQYFLHHIRREEGNMSRVADRVGLERTHLYRKLKQLGIRPSGKTRGRRRAASAASMRPRRTAVSPVFTLFGHRHDQHAVVVGRAHRLARRPRRSRRLAAAPPRGP